MERLEVRTRDLEPAPKQISELRPAQFEEHKIIQAYLKIPKGNSEPTLKPYSEVQRKNAILQSPHQATEGAWKAELSKITRELEDANQGYQELQGPRSRHACELEKTVSGLDQDLGAAKRRNAILTGELKAAKEQVHSLTTRAAGIQSSWDKVIKLEQDLAAVNQRIAILIAKLMAAEDHSHDFDAQFADLQSSQYKVTTLETDLGVANERITTLTTKLMATKEHSHNVDIRGSGQVQELESDIAALDQHSDWITDDGTRLMDGIQKITDESELAGKDVARFKAKVAELERELVDRQVAYEKETVENKARIDRILQLAVPQVSTSAPTQSSNPVRSKRSSPTSVTSTEKRTKTSETPNIEAIDLTSSDTEHGKTKIQGLVPNAADHTKFTLIRQSDLPQAIQDKVKGWIRKLDAHPLKNGMSPWLIARNKVATTCAVRRLHKGSSTWIYNNLDRACMDCSKKGYPCIVIRTSGPILLPSHFSPGLPSSDPEYWIRSTK